MKRQKQIIAEKLIQLLKHESYQYLISFIIFSIAAILQHLIWPYIEPAPFILFYPAVIVASLYGNGTLTIALSCVAYQYYFAPPNDSFQMMWPNDYLRMSLFIVASLMIKKIIAEQKKQKTQAQAAVERLKESEKNLMLEREAREKFVSTLTHDLQTPLTAVKLNLEFIKRRIDDPEVLTKGLTKSFFNIKRIEAMIQNLLDANRIKAGEKMQIQRSEISLNSVIEQTIKELTEIHGERFDTKCQEDITGYWSSEGIRRILENLCQNAVKYGDDSKITIRSEVIKDGVILSVNNKGSYIPEEESRKLFEPYQRSSSTGSEEKKGWGIGLTLVKGLTEAHHGRVSINSNKRDGTTFSVYLPQKINDH